MTKTLKKNKWLGVGLVLLAIFATALILFLYPPTSAKANPSQIPPTKSLNDTASTTQSYMTAGTGTTTPITYDSFSTGSDTKFNQVAIAFQAHASGTPVTIAMVVEDSPDNKDWYPRSVTITTATSTFQTGSFQEYRFPIATSTAQLGGTSNASTTVIGVTPRVHQYILVDAPMRYIRVKFFLPTGSGPAAIWAQMIPVREKQ